MLEALAIVGASARKRSDFLLGLSDNGRSSLLTLIANVLAIIRRCSQSWSPAHIICQREWRQRGTRLEPSAIPRSEEHTSELQSLMRNSYAVFCWQKKNKTSATRRPSTERRTI